MRILLPLDLSRFSQEALRVLAAQVRPGENEVRVLHVIEPIGTLVSAAMVPRIAAQTAQIEREREKEAHQLVERAAATLRKGGLKARGVVERGDPKAKIVAQAQKWNADLIVMGSHGLRGLSHFLMGSVSETVLRHAPCSVQVVRLRRGETKRGKK
jgi:universal stress protein A